MAAEPQEDPRPSIPRELHDRVVAKAKELGEEMADQHPAIIIRTILKRYVEGEPLRPKAQSTSAATKPASAAPQPTSSAKNPRAPSAKSVGGDPPSTRAVLAEKIYQYLRSTILPDGLTRQIGQKKLAEAVNVSATYTRRLVEELIREGRITVVEARLGRRGPRYRIEPE